MFNKPKYQNYIPLFINNRIMVKHTCYTYTHSYRYTIYTKSAGVDIIGHPRFFLCHIHKNARIYKECMLRESEYKVKKKILLNCTACC